MSKHTPGPWSINDACGSVFFSVEAPNGGQVAVLSDYGEPDDPDYDARMANARLIAAAPDLLEALRVCVAHLNGDIINTTRDGTLKAAMDAIAKAEGRS